LAPLIVRQIFGAIRKLNSEEKLTVFLVEQNAFHALNGSRTAATSWSTDEITLSGPGTTSGAAGVRAAYLEGGRRDRSVGEAACKPRLQCRASQARALRRPAEVDLTSGPMGSSALAARSDTNRIKASNSGF
jgi:hypothetical protein